MINRLNLIVPSRRTVGWNPKKRRLIQKSFLLLWDVAQTFVLPLEWLVLKMGNIGPLFGKAPHIALIPNFPYFECFDHHFNQIMCNLSRYNLYTPKLFKTAPVFGTDRIFAILEVSDTISNLMNHDTLSCELTRSLPQIYIDTI